VFPPVPPRADQPAPEHPGQPDEPDDAAEPNEAPDLDAALEADEPTDLEMPLLHRSPLWPAVVRWARLCRVLAFVTLAYFGWNAASYLYAAITGEVEPFVRPHVIPAWNLFYALVHTLFAVASCISLLGFAELLHLLMSIEATLRHNQDRSPRPDRADPSAT
jgi:hypothetical protein